MDGLKGTMALCLAGALSIFYLVAMGAWSWVEIDDLLAMTPNEFGDLLAGVFSPLAFLWLVLGYFQQGQELRASVRALELQGEELRNSVIQQRALVDVSMKQLEAEYEARRAQEKDSEYRAQPRFKVSSQISHSSRGNRIFDFKFENIGADCSDAKIILGNGVQAEMDHIKSGDRIKFEVDSNEPKLSDLEGHILYNDALGRPRRQRFTIEAMPPLFGAGAWTYKTPKIDKELQRPPFGDGHE